ncbi:flagellar hook-associated protein FlgK [Arcobacter sp. LA11]|uniref:flagellar hook-associated protein FlgK n=1 Tax=Arcobacter sp. LA11 TaxID=1898176 RepID=UPI0009FA954A|nr:flagellar basal body rod C-terminal domain-containing protein [Arcobacter sp. LA11]
MLKSLNVAQSGLNAAKIAVENVSNNIANENTPGYKKRVVQLSELALTDSRFTGRGVRADEAYRITSQYMYDNMMNENTKSNYFNEVSSMVGNIEAMFQETDSSGFSTDLDRYFQAVENLRSNPNSEIYRTTYKTQGKVVVDSLQNLYSNIEKQEELTRKSLEDNVEKVNSLINEIGSINQQLGQHKVASNDLLDKRDQLENELSEYVDIEVNRSNDEYELKIGGAIAVRYNTNIREVELVEDDSSQIDRFATTDALGNPIDNITDKVALDADDVITYKLNNEFEVSVTIGQQIFEADGVTPVDFDPSTPGADTVDSTNYLRALTYKINHDANISQTVDAYNGNYAVDANGNKVDSTTEDKFLVIESRVSGEEGSFQGRISVTKMTGTTVDSRDVLFKDEYQSAEAKNNVYLSVFDSEVKISSGIIKAQTENLTTDSVNNKIVDYKNKLDNFARSLSDLYDKYVKTGEEEYLYGHVATDDYDGTANIKEINLFSGTDVKTLKFDQDAVNDLLQSDLDYMATIQWKKDVEFDGFAQDGSSVYATSFSEFYQEIRVNISSDKENNDFLLEAQEAVEQSLQFSYDQLTKVDNDEEMVNLIKFQAAYTANAKIITVVDEMLQTILGIR